MAKPAHPPAAEQAAPAAESTSVVDMLAPIGGQLTLGSTLGFCAGIALRYAGRVAAVGVGTTFCVIQGLAYRGYIKVDWRTAERDFIRILDADHDGEITSADLAKHRQRVSDVLAFNLPAGAGFTAGLAYGLGLSANASWKAALVTGVG